MPVIWILANDPISPETVRVHLEPLGEVVTGEPEAALWRAAPPADAVVWIGEDAGPSAREPGPGLERWLGFLRAQARSRAPAALLYLEPPDAAAPFVLIRALVDDRPLARLDWPPDPEDVVAATARLLAGRALPVGMRERARHEWVVAEMERLYADLDLPALRHAIDPRNASRPVLLRGEPGTRRGLVAQYIHQLAEPRREALIVVPAAAVRPGEAERRVLEPTAGRRVTLVLQGIDEADDAVQRELAHLLGESGSQGVESLRWIATARPRRLRGALRDVPWLEVDLPPLRHRPDLPRLARAVAAERARLARRAIELSDTALERLAAYAWPRNLRELEQTLDRSVQACPGDRLDADGLLFAPPGRGRRKPHAWVEERPARGSAEPERIRAADESAPPPSAEPLVTEPAEEVSEAEAPLTTTPPPAALLSAAVRELKGPLLALRAQAHLGAQPRSDPAARADLGATREGELAEIEQTLRRLEAFASFGPPRIEPVDVAACARSELDQRQNAIHKRSIVVLRELDADAPRARADAVQLRFAIGALFDRALRMVPEGGDLYVASRRRAGPAGEPAAHRLMIRFHSPEEVLGGPEDLPGTAVHLEVLLARSLVERMGGEFAADTSGAQDNVVLIELPI